MNRIPKPFIYIAVLVAVLGIGIWIGRSGTDKPIAEKIQQTADVSGSVRDIVNENKENSPTANKNNESQSVEPPDINSIRAVKVIRVLDGDTIAISMNNWLLKDSSASNKYKFGSFTLDGAKGVIIYSGCGVDAQDKLYWQCPEGNYAVWNNTGDHAFLYDASGNLITEYQY